MTVLISWPMAQMKPASSLDKKESAQRKIAVSSISLADDRGTAYYMILGIKIFMARLPISPLS